MKIKRVEIQAFRAYGAVEDATFDFAISTDQCADFVSIYAPNGFGKTSFYDAIEWCVTNNIYRFVRRETLNKSYAQDEKQLRMELDNSKSPLLFIRNKTSSSDLLGYVRIYFDNPEYDAARDIPKIVRKDGSDYSFDEKFTEKSFFRDVILSQENIDAFLKEDNPEIRYSKFMSVFGDAHLDQAYTNILYLLKFNDESITELEKEFAAIQLSLPLNVDHNILDKVNESIAELNTAGITVPIISPNSSDTELLKVANCLSEAMLDLKSKLEKSVSELENLREINISLPEYFQNSERISEIENKTAELKRVQGLFNELDELRNELRQSDQTIESLTNKGSEYQEVNLLLEEYNLIAQTISEQNDLSKKLKITLEEEKIAVENLRVEMENAAKSELTISSDISRINKQIDNLPIEFARKEEVLKRLNDLKKNIILLGKDADLFIKQRSELETRLRKVEFFNVSVKKNEYPSELLESFSIEALVLFIQNVSTEISSCRTDIAELEVEIKSQSTLNDDLKRLLLLATEVIETSGISDCPVCLTKFENQATLINSIVNNPVLSDRIQQLLKRKNEYEKNLSLKLKSLSDYRSQIIELINTEFASVRAQIGKIDEQISSNQIELSVNNNQISDLSSSLERLQAPFGQKTIAQIDKELKSKLDVLLGELSKTQERLTTIRKDIIFKQNTNESLLSQIVSSENAIKLARTNTVFLRVTKFLSMNRLLVEDQSKISYLISSVNSQIQLSVAERESLLKRIKTNEDLIAKYNPLVIKSEFDILQQQNFVVNSEQRKLKARYTAYKITPEGISLDTIKRETEQKLAEHTALINKYENTIGIISRTEEFKKNVSPYLTFSKMKARRNFLESEIAFLKNVVGTELKKEKDQLAQHINEQIQSFFFEDLINRLYCKIDPHPTYKEIRFKCDFSGDKPKMNVFVANDERSFVIPNLYFSTAQMNILSLSIFLAKALNAKRPDGKPIDCIFIDDPIQSMDSINILSTIDLFRSLVVNFKKQIILSTHDENFHHLLQKKLPSPQFNSKFIELETLGVVRTQ